MHMAFPEMRPIRVYVRAFALQYKNKCFFPFSGNFEIAYYADDCSPFEFVALSY